MSKGDGMERGKTAMWLLLQVLLVHAAIPQSASTRINKLRLSGSQQPHQGNVEVKVDGVWGYVCDDNFGFDEADMVCRDIGYDSAETFTRNNHFGENSAEWRRSSVKFWMSEVNCSSATTFSNCTSAPLGEHLCGPTEIAGVSCRVAGTRCETHLFPCSTGSTCLPRDLVCNNATDCDDGSDEAVELCEDVGVTRLASNLANANIPGAALGMVYVKHSGEWGTICDNNFDNSAAKVICRSLGYEGGWSLGYGRTYLGIDKEDSKIWVESIDCQGNEEWIGQCPSVDFAENECIHIEDSSVFCYDMETEVRLSGSGKEHGSGIVEMRLGGEWGTVCASRFDDFDAQVVCKMLGYDGDDSQAYKEERSAAYTVWQMHLDCLGHETHVHQCGLRFNNESCTSSAGVICSSTSGALNSALQSYLPHQCGEAKDASTQFLTRLAKVRSGSIPTHFDHPWLISLRRRQIGADPAGILQCGGTIISEFYVLTAAHCLRQLGSLNLVIRVGDYNVNFREDNEEEYFIDKVWTHEDFSRYSYNDNDIALLKVEAKNGQGIRFGPKVMPLCLPRVSERYEDLTDCSIVGWGRTSVLATNPSLLNEGKVVIKPGHDCENGFVKGTNNFTSSFVCAGDDIGSVNACLGDSGGPLSCRRRGENKKSLYGIISIGNNCQLFLSPDILTRVSKYLRWIYDKISKSI